MVPSNLHAAGVANGWQNNEMSAFRTPPLSFPVPCMHFTPLHKTRLSLSSPPPPRRHHHPHFIRTIPLLTPHHPPTSPHHSPSHTSVSISNTPHFVNNYKRRRFPRKKQRFQVPLPPLRVGIILSARVFTPSNDLSRRQHDFLVRGEVPQPLLSRLTAAPTSRR